MQANPKPGESEKQALPKAAAELSVADGRAAHMSPARALQARLVKELSGAPGRSWPWHSAGLVLTAILALWLAGLMLHAGL